MPERKIRARAAVQAASRKIEKMLRKSPAYRKVEDGLYAVKQGSSMVMIKVHPWKDHAVVRLVAQLVKGVSMDEPLTLELLGLNAVLRFGAFAYVPEGQAIVLCHTLLDRDLGNRQEFLESIRDFAFVADDFDDRIAARYGGQTMEDLMEESVLANVRKVAGPDPADQPLAGRERQ
ncbi:MAG: hypothetical protein JXP73_13330 [Deltaproteobacteria bacterium]|jgi:hypothetical protein|nr:hypothetical protein [Deltaproteobacteria bacterium]